MNNKRIILSIFWVALGITLVILSVIGVIDSSVYAGMGGALAAIGIMQVMRHIRYRRDEKYREQIDIAVCDERNRFLRLQSWGWTGYIVVLVESCGIVIAMITGQHLVEQILVCSVCLMLVVYWLSYLVLSRKY